MTTKFEQLSVPEERLNVYWKLRDTLDYLASTVHNHKLHVRYRLRATQALSEIAKTLRIFIMDEEKIQELEKKVEKLKQLIEQRKE